MHFYNFHIKDYRAKTAHLTPLEHYVYRTLIDWYYLSEKPFETVEQIARYLLLPMTDESTQAINNVLDEFFVFKNNAYRHERLDRELGLLGRLPWSKWKVIRQRIFDRDDHTCAYCGVTGVALECDHIMPISKGGSNDDDNLTTACEPCNRSKGSKLLEEWR